MSGSSSDPRPTGTGARKTENLKEGFALVAVLLFLMIATAAITPFVLAARTDFAIAAGKYQSDRMNFLAKGIADDIARTLSVPIEIANDIELPTNSRPLRSVCGNILVDVTIQDQSGLIDLNAAPHLLLQAGFNSVGFKGPGAKRSANLTVAFRQPAGPRSKVRLGPNELAHGLKHGPFEAIEEIYDLRAVQRVPVSDIKRTFTIYGRSPTIVANRMPAALAKILPSQPSGRYPFIDTRKEPSEFYRIDVKLRHRGSNAGGFSGAVYQLQRDETNGFNVIESSTDPALTLTREAAFKSTTRCEDLFAPELAQWIRRI